MKELNKIVEDLNNTDLQSNNITDILNIKNSSGEDALMVACRLGLANAVDKLSKEFTITKIKKSGSDSLVREAEIGGFGSSPIENGSHSYSESKTVQFDCQRKDNLGRSALQYAVENKNKNIIAILSKNINMNNFLIKGLEPLHYFITELCRTYKQDQENLYHISSIIDRLTLYPDNIERLEPIAFNAFCSCAYRFDALNDISYCQSLNRLCKKVSQECLNSAFNIATQPIKYEDTINVGSYQNEMMQYQKYYQELKNRMALQKILLKNGAKLTKEQIDSMNYNIKMFKSKFKNSMVIDLDQLELTANELVSTFDDIYTIDSKDFNTVIGKSNQVIETTFGKKTDDVLSSYIEQGQVDFESIQKAVNFSYDTDKKETRIGIISRLGADVSEYSSKNKSAFKGLTDNQINDILKANRFQLSDLDIDEILNRKFIDVSNEDFKNIYNTVLNYNYKGDLEQYKKRLEESKFNFSAEEYYYQYDIQNVLIPKINQQIISNLQNQRDAIVNEQLMENINVTPSGVKK